MQIAEQRGWNVVERHDKRSVHTDSIRIDVETDSGVTSVEGAVVLGKPRLLQVDGIYCEAALAGFLILMKNQDVPGVIGHVGTVLGRNVSTSRTSRWGGARRRRRKRWRWCRPTDWCRRRCWRN